jgi:hypothetical protein
MIQMTKPHAAMIIVLPLFTVVAVPAARAGEGVVFPPEAGVKIEHVADAQPSEQNMVIAGDDIYFAEMNEMKRVPTKGGEAVTVAENVTTVQGLMAQGTDLIWTETNASAGPARVATVPMRGGRVRSLFEGFVVEGSLAADANTIWLVTGADERHRNTVVSIPRRGTPTVKQVAKFKRTVCSLAVDAQFIYASECDEQRIVRIPRGGGSAQVVIDFLEEPYRLTLAGDSIIFDTRGNGGFWQVPKAGGKPTGVTALAGLTGSYAADEKDLFFIPTPVEGHYTGRDAAVVWVHRKPTSTTTLDADMGYPAAIAIDRTHVYWVRHNKEIVRARRDALPPVASPGPVESPGP